MIVPFVAWKMAASKVGSCWPLVTPSSLPPWFLEAGSVESFFATLAQFAPEPTCCFAWFALSGVLVRITSRSRRSGWLNCCLFLL